MRLSICIATYNGAKYIDDQLASIYSQLGDGDEIVIADDGSTDDTISRVLRIGRQTRLVSINRVGGVVANFERVLTAAVGDGLVLCDQDDVWLPGRLDIIRQSLMYCDLVLLNAQVVDEDLISRNVNLFELIGRRHGFCSNFIKNSFVGCCMAFRRELRDRALPFPSYLPWHDWYLGLLAECVGRVDRIETVTMLYRRHQGNFSQTGEKSRYSLFHKIVIRAALIRALFIAVLLRRPKLILPCGFK